MHAHSDVKFCSLIEASHVKSALPVEVRLLEPPSTVPAAMQLNLTVRQRFVYGKIAMGSNNYRSCFLTELADKSEHVIKVSKLCTAWFQLENCKKSFVNTTFSFSQRNSCLEIPSLYVTTIILK